MSTHTDPGGSTVVVAIPCYNEAVTIGKVVRDFRRVLPQARVYVFDNNSMDGSAELACEAGAIVSRVRRQGKGHVMQAIFNSVVADTLVVVDGDDTYCAEEVSLLVDPIMRGEAEMVVGNRLQQATSETLRPRHQFGNRVIVSSINFMFGTSYTDILSGYRALSRRFIEFVPLLTPGFETETELTLQALERGLDVIEVPISYRSRPAGSRSKLRSFHDGYRIMMTAIVLLRDHHPLRFFGLISLLCVLTGGMASLLRLMVYWGMIDFPTTLLTGLLLLVGPIGMIALGIGLLLNAINTRFREMEQLARRKRGQQIDG